MNSTMSPGNEYTSKCSDLVICDVNFVRIKVPQNSSYFSESAEELRSRHLSAVKSECIGYPFHDVTSEYTFSTLRTAKTWSISRMSKWTLTIHRFLWI